MSLSLYIYMAASHFFRNAAGQRPVPNPWLSFGRVIGLTGTIYLRPVYLGPVESPIRCLATCFQFS